jgi:hypothetical protein
VIVLLGFVYSVVATRYSYALRLSPAMLTSHIPLGRLLVGPLWPMVLLMPVTIGTDGIPSTELLAACDLNGDDRHGRHGIELERRFSASTLGAGRADRESSG